MVDGEERELREQLPYDFLVRVMLRYSKLLNGSVEKVLVPCDYHAHNSEDGRQLCDAADWNGDGDEDYE